LGEDFCLGNPTETAIAFVDLIFSDVLGRHPRLKICAARGGYFSFYTARFDHSCSSGPRRIRVALH